MLALCAAVVASGGVTACGGKADAKPRSSVSATATGTTASPTASAPPASNSVLDEQQLKSFLVGSTDITSFDVKLVGEGGSGLGIALGQHLGLASLHPAVKPAACQPLEELTGFDSAYHPHAYTEQTVVYQFTNNGPVSLTMSLASYEADDAHKVITDLTTALHSCRSFTSLGGVPTVAYSHLTAVGSPGLGDEGVSFRLTQSVKSRKTSARSPVVFTVVRTGKIVAAYYTTTPDGAGQDLTHDVIKPQTEKLMLPLT